MTFTDSTRSVLRRTTDGRRLRRAVAALSCVLLLGACSPDESTTGAEPVSDQVAFPRSIVVPASTSTEADTVQIPAAPQRVAALTYETAELVAALGASDRLVMVPKAVTNPVLTHHHEDMTQVETKAATESTTNAEAVIATAPDLVLLSARHGLEDGAGQVLAAAGIPVLVLPNSWGTFEDMLSNIDLVGQALGLDSAATSLADKIDNGLTTAGATAESDEPSEADADASLPRVLVLSNQAGQPFVTTGAAFPMEILRHAGAEDAAADLGMSHSGPITAEQVIQAKADAILLIDMNGSGRKIFTPLLKNAAVAALPAVADERILLVEGRQVQALGLDGVIDGLEEISTWLANNAD